jgi:hypothetical protein
MMPADANLHPTGKDKPKESGPFGPLSILSFVTKPQMPVTSQTSYSRHDMVVLNPLAEGTVTVRNANKCPLRATEKHGCANV